MTYLYIVSKYCIYDTYVSTYFPGAPFFPSSCEEAALVFHMLELCTLYLRYIPVLYSTLHIYCAVPKCIIGKGLRAQTL